MEPTRRHVEKLLHAQARDNAARDARIAALEAEGYRIVAVGQVGACGEDGKAFWEVRDWRTDELLASGRSEARNTFSATRDEWWDIGRIWADVAPGEVEPTEGVPPSLAETLADWLSLASTSDEEVAEYVGWSVEQVKRSRG
ncbi:hypothetical protein HNR06_000953 [Nocardiopsis arvandica]|uniref:Uncharacterized protein n=1 Tax=Nocardiopsis sinuspersici TaxID=501010 RepID=A0A7Z0BJG7_9ACTN|nr:hypothetical protein [Nocardiopsis sinuspersici]